jgi:allantoinase
MSSGSPDLILRSRRVVTPEGLRPAGILVKAGVIVEIVDGDASLENCAIEDAGNLVVMPGLVDSHVHLNDPGHSDWEGFETGTKAAAVGGFTTLVDMPLNSLPVTTTVEALHAKVAAASGNQWVDCGFYAGLLPSNSRAIEPLIQAGVLGVKAFLIHSGLDEFPNAAEIDLRAAMPAIARHGLPLLIHAELAVPSASSSNDIARKHTPRSYAHYLASRPPAWELAAIELMIKLCKEFQCRVHIVHLSAAAAVPLLRAARQQGLPITVETCPHYLFFAAAEISDGDTRFKCAPPIRERENREQLWDALNEGVIDFIASDHSPCPPEMKRLDAGDFRNAWGGIASLQFGLSIIWTAARPRGLSIHNVSEWMSRRPAKFLGLGGRKGAIAKGYDADFVIWNPEATFTLSSEMIHHRHKVTPYTGQTLFGVVEKTFLRGIEIYERDSFLLGPMGRTILRKTEKPP